MQTFLPYADFEKSAQVLDNKRLGKQKVECYQILNTLKKGSILSDGRKTPWYNHPAVKMWKGYEISLVRYGWYICEEWKKRGFKDNTQLKILFLLGNIFSMNENIDNIDIIDPFWLGDERFHASHRSNLLRKNPIHYGKFGWVEPNDLPYFWPTKMKA